MKYFLNILAILFILIIALPQDATASCCTTTDICHEEAPKKHQDEPCGSSGCHCICCGSITIILLENPITETENQEDLPFFSFSYQSLFDSNFNSTIWQPPRLR